MSLTFLDQNGNVLASDAGSESESCIGNSCTAPSPFRIRHSGRGSRFWELGAQEGADGGWLFLNPIWYANQFLWNNKPYNLLKHSLPGALLTSSPLVSEPWGLFGWCRKRSFCKLVDL